jgi:steroid 5-alpha reductase family enzyme
VGYRAGAFTTLIDVVATLISSPSILVAMAWSAVAVLGTMVGAFLVGRIKHRYRDIDVFWPLGFVVVALVGFASTSGAEGADVLQRVLLVLMVSVWGLRLATHLGLRSRGEGEDPRYRAIMKGAKGRSEVLYAIVVVYALQGILMFVISLPITVGMHVSSPAIGLQAAGLALWLLGFTFEAVGDAQLEAFKRDPSARGKVMDRGLWAWTRHPNYFGDACLWWGISLVGASGFWASPATALIIVSPLIMTRLLTSVSGKPLLEARMAKTREGFADYVERTSAFFPRPPRKPKA